VKIVDKIKEKAAIFNLKKELKMHKRAVAINNFTTASTAGVIFDAIDREKYQLAREFIEFIEKNNTRVFGIGIASKNDQIAYFPYKQGIDYFGANEVNWFGKPSNPVINDFLKRNFDILFDLTLTDSFSIHYLFALSVAKFKITNDSIKTEYADFVLQVSNKEKLGNYINMVKHYLGVMQIKQ
jgi:hypothetical protein